MTAKNFIACAVLVLSLVSCDKSSPPIANVSVPPKATASPAQQVRPPDDTYDWARNIEMVPFCLPLPKGEYVLDEKSELPRGSLAYLHKTRKADTIEVRGLMRSDPSVRIADYFRNSYAKAEESGEVIEEKKLLDAQGMFYVRGYMNNKIHEQRFIEITWLRKDEVVIYTAVFALSEVAAWQKRLDTLLQHNSRCE